MYLIIQIHYKDCAILSLGGIFVGHGIYHCDLMKEKVILHWITMKYAASHMKIPLVRDCAIFVMLERWYTLKKITLVKYFSKATVIGYFVADIK